MPNKKSLARLKNGTGQKVKPKKVPFVRDHGPAFDELAQRLPYQFKDIQLLKLALTHSSMGYEIRRQYADNQRLEFLGDAVLQLALSNHLYALFPNDKEGLLSKLRTRLVHAGALARVARQLNLGAGILMSRGVEMQGGRDHENILADAMEAVLGAVFLDGGFDTAAAFVIELWNDEITVVKETPVEQNPKGQLQEIIQEHTGSPPNYRIIDCEGPDHSKTFKAVVSCNGTDLGSGVGKSKREAEIGAALEALKSPVILQFQADKKKTEAANIPSLAKPTASKMAHPNKSRAVKDKPSFKKSRKDSKKVKKKHSQL